MDEHKEGRCSRLTAAVSPQRSWRSISRESTSAGVFRKRGDHRRTFAGKTGGRRYDSQGEEEENEGSSSSSGSEDICNDVPFRINERLICNGCNKRRPSFSDTESVLDIVKMPVGTANSILKSSFSLTSLRSSTPMDSPDHGTPLRLKTERPYYSLTKKSRQSSEQDKEQWRKSWGSGISQDGKEFWEGFQADYDYLMAQNILDRDVSEMQMENVPGGTPRAPPVWSHSEFMDHFAQLYSWLKGIQDSVYGKQENVTDWKLRAERQEDMQRQRFRLDNFNEESKKLIARHPESESKVLWRVKHINDKWETVEAMMGACKKGEAEKGSREKIEHELKCLGRWLRDFDARLKPLSFQQGWTEAELDAKTKEHMVLHRDIEAHGKIVSSLLKLCEKADTPSFSAAARARERKYHELYLRSLEWLCHIESLVGLQLNKNPSSVNNESDGEPVAKIARITSSRRPEEEEADEEEEEEDVSDESSREDDWSMETSVDGQPPRSSPPAAMVGPRLDGPEESILELEGSAPMLGTPPKNVNVFVSCENHAEKTTPVRIDTVDGGRIDDGHSNRLRDTDTAATPEANRSKVKPPNTKTFTWTHRDTDSEQEQEKRTPGSEGKRKEGSDGKDAETTSSEDGWTFSPATQTEQSRPKAAVRLDFKKGGDVSTEKMDSKQIKYFSAKNIPRSNSHKMLNTKEPISSTNRKLVELADELVRSKSKPWKPRRRTRRGRREEPMEVEAAADDGGVLPLCEPMDSCDASGEYTTEDPDDADSQAAEDEEESPSGSAEGFSDETRPPPEPLLRAQKHLRHRPWSMSSVSCLRTPRGHGHSKPRASMSESALNQMIEQERFYSTPGRGYRGVGGEAPSSRRRRPRTRRRTSKKSESGSDAATPGGSDGTNSRHPPALVKSGSFSEVSRRQREFSPFESPTGTETDEDAAGLALPVFRLGPSAGVVTVVTEQQKGQAEEQLSLNWDNYQEKYQSEAYSEEPPDSDAAKKILEFGEDYGKYLGNLSDCPSTRGRWFTGGRTRSKVDSDSDVDDVRKFLQQSVEQLDLWEMKFNRTVGGLVLSNDLASEEVVSRTFFDEIMGACKRNVDYLSKLLMEVKDEVLLAKEQNDIEYVKESWESLKSTAELHKAKQLREEMAAFRRELLQLGAAVDAMETTVTSREELEAKITQIQNELNLMKKSKGKLLQANVSVHHFLASARHSDPGLRDQVTDLYQVWDQTFCRVSSRLLTLQGLSQTWLDFEDHLAELQGALKSDALKVLDIAVKCRAPSTDATLCLRDIATVLYDKESATKDSVAPLGGSSAALAALSTEGSLSDSGISDSGSEQELSEREKRLAQLKRLAKSLEGILAPGSQALSNMFKRIEQAETELRDIQKKCRDLLVRSASSEEIRMIVANAPAIGALDAEVTATGAVPKGVLKAAQGSKGNVPLIGQMVERLSGEEELEEAEGETESDGERSGKKFWFWRLLRFSLPFQLALVALLCVACMMQPRCCDSVNNLDLSLNPQLRYDSGPPPV